VLVPGRTGIGFCQCRAATPGPAVMLPGFAGSLLLLGAQPSHRRIAKPCRLAAKGIRFKPFLPPHHGPPHPSRPSASSAASPRKVAPAAFAPGELSLPRHHAGETVASGRHDYGFFLGGGFGRAKWDRIPVAPCRTRRAGLTWCPFYKKNTERLSRWTSPPTRGSRGPHDGGLDRLAASSFSRPRYEHRHTDQFSPARRRMKKSGGPRHGARPAGYCTGAIAIAADAAALGNLRRPRRNSKSSGSSLPGAGASMKGSIVSAAPPPPTTKLNRRRPEPARTDLATRALSRNATGWWPCVA